MDRFSNGWIDDALVRAWMIRWAPRLGIQATARCVCGRRA